MNTSEKVKKFTAVRNACKLCAPLGAAMVFRGIAGAMPFFHGSQGCATYIRRYIISHFREPMDIASSNFSEQTAIFGGRQNLKLGLENLCLQYQPSLIGIATTCLAETIGDDVNLFLSELRNMGETKIVVVSTPSFKGAHSDGFHWARKAVIDRLVQDGSKQKVVNIFPAFLSAADLRHLKEILQDFGLPCVILPDYSETLDGPIWEEYRKIPPGGTPLSAIMALGRSAASIEFARSLPDEDSAGYLLFKRFQVPFFKIGIPIGVQETDIFFNLLEKLSGLARSPKYLQERGRLIDAYADGHKYLFGKKAVVYGEADLVIGVVSFLSEIGVQPVLTACGEKNKRFVLAIKEVAGESADKMIICDDTDFAEIGEKLKTAKPDFLIGNSKGYSLARQLGVPLVRIGFPVHDRIGGQRILHLGYRGTQQLFDRIVNTLLEKKQEDSEVGYSYL